MLEDKPWYKSFMVIGAALFAASTVFEQSGLLVPGTSVAATTVVKALGEFFALVGARRKLGEIATK